MSERDDLDKLTEALNAAGRAERPSAKKKEAILEAVLAKAGGGGSGSAGSKRRPVLWLSVLALLVAVGTWQVATRSGPGAPVEPLPPTQPVAPPEPVAVETVKPPGQPLPPDPPGSEDAGGALAPTPPVEPRLKPPPPTRPPAEEDDALAREVTLLDEARGAVLTEPARALSLLERHRREFPRGALLVEAELVRLEAFLKRGRRAEAERIAQRLIAAGPETPVAARARRLLEEVP